MEEGCSKVSGLDCKNTEKNLEHASLPQHLHDRSVFGAGSAWNPHERKEERSLRVWGQKPKREYSRSVKPAQAAHGMSCCSVHPTIIKWAEPTANKSLPLLNAQYTIDKREVGYKEKEMRRTGILLLKRVSRLHQWVNSRLWSTVFTVTHKNHYKCTLTQWRKVDACFFLNDWLIWTWELAVNYKCCHNTNTNSWWFDVLFLSVYSVGWWAWWNHNMKLSDRRNWHVCSDVSSITLQNYISH